jgi:hypothetical protein
MARRSNKPLTPANGGFPEPLVASCLQSIDRASLVLSKSLLPFEPPSLFADSSFVALII